MRAADALKEPRNVFAIVVKTEWVHLDEQLVEPGQWVEPGDVVGRVGNTGNARTTPPHLHFAIYAEGQGPIDPDPFLR